MGFIMPLAFSASNNDPDVLYKLETELAFIHIPQCGVLYIMYPILDLNPLNIQRDKTYITCFMVG